jgi:HD-GYP domain-containing protein (c-di-GMP phosphodiesterase class II)
LAGEDIPVLGRIIAVADAYDAMTSDRPYRRGMAPSIALLILEEGKGSQWDPVFAQVFVDHMRAQLFSMRKGRA